MRRVIIDYYSQGHWIKLLNFLRDKLRGAGHFPVGLSETFYAAFSKNYQGRISRRMCARGGQQIPKQRFHPNTLKTRKCGKHGGRDVERCVGEILRYKRLRHSACNRCSGETSRRGVSRGLHRGPWDFRLRNFFHMLHAQGFTDFGEACGLDVVGLRQTSAQTPSTDFDLPHPPL